jgi:hypothetical protein
MQFLPWTQIRALSHAAHYSASIFHSLDVNHAMPRFPAYRGAVASKAFRSDMRVESEIVRNGGIQIFYRCPRALWKE